MITDHELDTIRSASVSRRSIFKGAGVAAGLTIFWKTGATAQNATPETTPVPPARPMPPTSLDAYVRINEDGTATVLTGKIEYGQGIQTGFVQIIAEELSLPFESVTAVMGQTDTAPFDIGTFGSLSTQFTGPRLRQAGAGMRLWLLDLGAQQLQLDVSEVGLVDGTVASLTDPSMSVTYAELAAGQQTAMELDPNVALKDPATYTMIGASVPRPDVSQKVNGSMIYGIDATVEGMVWGKIVRPTGFGFTLSEIDFSAAESMPGVVGTFRDGDFAGIAAETLQQVEAAHAAVTATWVDPQSPITSENIHDSIVETADAGRQLGVEESEDESATPPPAPEIANPIQLTFKAPYVCHTPIEPRTSLVQITPERVDVYASTQDP
ncbi:MAG: molybdopterin cofactor-binding domain-containing protein [Thermomicrobiales bacterium]